MDDHRLLEPVGERSDDRDRWLRLPFVGCDGVTKTGQSWVRTGLLAATVIIPATAIGQKGYLMGMTATTNAEDMAIISLMFQPEIGTGPG